MIGERTLDWTDILACLQKERCKARERRRERGTRREAFFWGGGEWRLIGSALHTHERALLNILQSRRVNHLGEYFSIRRSIVS